MLWAGVVPTTLPSQKQHVWPWACPCARVCAGEQKAHLPFPVLLEAVWRPAAKGSFQVRPPPQQLPSGYLVLHGPGRPRPLTRQPSLRRPLPAGPAAVARPPERCGKGRGHGGGALQALLRAAAPEVSMRSACLRLDGV
jgi:hypothetical protein